MLKRLEVEVEVGNGREGWWPGGRGDRQVLARQPPAAGPRMSPARPSADQLAHGWVASLRGPGKYCTFLHCSQAGYT